MTRPEKSLKEIEAEGKKQIAPEENNEQKKEREARVSMRRVPWRMSGLASALRPGLMTIILFFMMVFVSLVGVKHHPGAYADLTYLWTGKPVAWEWTGKFGHTHQELLDPSVEGYSWLNFFSILMLILLAWITLMLIGRWQGAKNYAAEKRWIASFPFPIKNYPETLGDYDSTAFDLAIFYNKKKAPDEDRMNRIALGLHRKTRYSRDHDGHLIYDRITLRFQSDNFWLGKRNAYRSYKALTNGKNLCNRFC